MATSSQYFAQDDFTSRLLKVFYDLHSKNAIHRKKDFTNAIGITLNHFHLLERNMRNYAKDEEKRMKARAGLYENFGVNPEWLKGASEVMYLREPVSKYNVEIQPEVQVSYYAKKQKGKLEADLQHYKHRVEELENQVLILQEALAQCESKQNPDKAPDKRKVKK